jgi:chorismate lyase/3-hydroxybenzoate synthase
MIRPVGGDAPLYFAPIHADHRMPSPDATAARLRIAHADRPDALLRFEFDPGPAHPQRIACERLDGPAEPESWCNGEIHESAETLGAAWAHGDAYAMVAVSVEEGAGGVEAAAAEAYSRLLAAVRPTRHPYLLRIWNYFAAINAGQGDAERYRRFCVGRARAVDAPFNDPPPAATAIGTDGEPDRVQLIALCAKDPAIALENPRQTPAWRYPREYGPVPPGFSRGVLLDAETDKPRLLASGTASIVGHVSQHVGDVEGQLKESLANLDALLAEGEKKCGRRFRLDDCEALRVYLRNAEDLAVAEALVTAAGIGREKVLYLRGDVCRRELDVELEGVFVAE